MMNGWLEFLLTWDVWLFRQINGELYWRPAAQAVAFLADDRILIALLALAGLVYWRLRGLKNALVLGLSTGLGVLIVNLAHNFWLKPWFARPRPFTLEPDLHLAVRLYDLSRMSLSFPSTHSASAAALATIIAIAEPRLVIWSVCFALGIGAGAVYSGGHYPLDVLAGYAVGSLIGLPLAFLTRSSLSPYGPDAGTESGTYSPLESTTRKIWGSMR